MTEHQKAVIDMFIKLGQANDIKNPVQFARGAIDALYGLGVLTWRIKPTIKKPKPTTLRVVDFDRFTNEPIYEAEPEEEIKWIG